MSPTRTPTLPPPPALQTPGVGRAAPPPPTWIPCHAYRPIGALGGWLEGVTASAVVASLALAVAAQGIEVEGDLVLVPSAVQVLLIAVAALVVAVRVLAHVWTHRATGNAEALGASGLDFTPASSVWWWYVPVLSLWKPAQAVHQIAKASHPDDEPGTAWRTRDAGPLVVLWWAAYVVLVVAGQVALTLGGGTVDRAAWTIVGLGLATALSLWWALVHRTTRLQRHRAVRRARAGHLDAQHADHGRT